jgi:hypothetical protein
MSGVHEVNTIENSFKKTMLERHVFLLSLLFLHDLFCSIYWLCCIFWVIIKRCQFLILASCCIGTLQGTSDIGSSFCVHLIGHLQSISSFHWLNLTKLYSSFLNVMHAKQLVFIWINIIIISFLSCIIIFTNAPF